MDAGKTDHTIPFTPFSGPFFHLALAHHLPTHTSSTNV